MQTLNGTCFVQCNRECDAKLQLLSEQDFSLKFVKCLQKKKEEKKKTYQKKKKTEIFTEKKHSSWN